jgi:membrane protein implicated in regulation of membrane protease activity
MNTLALIDQVTGWWDELTLAKQFFYGTGIIAGLIAVILMVLSVFGMEHDDLVDAMATGGDLDHGGGIFSVKPLTGFFLGFGWVGGLALDFGATFFVALALAVIAGVGIMALIVFMFRTIVAMRSDGTAQIADTIGEVGTVYLTLPPSRGAGGQVTVNFRGRQETYAALQTGATPVPSGEKVKVLGTVDTRTLLVERLI